MMFATLLSKTASPVLAMPRVIKRSLVLVLDVAICVATVWAAFDLRLEQFTAVEPQMWVPMLVSIVLAIPIFVVSGLYRAIFRYSGLPAMLSLARAMSIYGVIYAGLFTFWGVSGVPRTVGFVQPMLLHFVVGASRAFARVWLGGLYHQQLRRASIPQALIYGAGSAGRQLAAALANSPEMRVVGFLDDDDRLHGNELNGVPIYNPADLPEVLPTLSVTDVLLALPSVSRMRRNEILNDLKPHKLAVRKIGRAHV